jgi:hypothetical protein
MLCTRRYPRVLLHQQNIIARACVVSVVGPKESTTQGMDLLLPSKSPLALQPRGLRREPMHSVCLKLPKHNFQRMQAHARVHRSPN